MKQKLFLASEAKNTVSLEKLKLYCKGFKGKTIVYVPTAANGEFYGSWKGGESIKVVQSLEAEVRIVELEDIKFKDVLEEVKKSDILWMAGGMAGYLLYWIRRVGLEKILPEMLGKGVLYVGSSAGSMICSKTQYSSEWYIGDTEPGASLFTGLGLINFEIYPHYEEELLPKIKKLHKEGSLYLLKDGEAIVVEDNSVKVLGDERILKNK
jgi:peptidase E